MNDPILYWWAISGVKSGPASLEKVRDLVRNGTIPRTASLWSAGWEDWKSLDSVTRELAIPDMRSRPAVEPLSAVPAKQAYGDKVMGWFVIVFLGALAIGTVCGGIFVWKNGASHPVLFVKARDAVESQLKAPATAVFPRGGECQFESRDGKVVIHGYVDSQNGFGALIRAKWVATFDNGTLTNTVLLEHP